MKNIRNSRLHSVDICRGFAVLLMIEAHIQPHIGLISSVSLLMAAPFFLIVSGLSYDLFLSSRLLETEVKRSIFLESLFRGFLIYTIPIIPYIIVGVFFASNFTYATGNNNYELNFFHWGVFQVIGVGYIIGLLVPNNLKSKMIATTSAFIITYLISNFFQNSLYFLINGTFPLFPWIGYFLFGRIIYELYEKQYFKTDTTLLGFSIVFVFIALFIFKIIGIDILSRDQVSVFLLISSIILLILSLFRTYVDHKHYSHRFFNPLKNIGKICFSAYYIHFILLFLLEKSAHFLLTNYPDVVLNLIIFLSIVVILVKLEKIWKDYNYIFGLEWLLRTSTGLFLKLFPYPKSKQYTV